MSKRIRKQVLIALIGILVSGALSTTIESNAETITKSPTEQSIAVSKERSAVKKGKVTTNSLNVRSGASTNKSVIGSLKKGSTVEIVSTSSNGWHKIRFKNDYGYVSGKYISISSNTNTNTNTNSTSSIKVTHTGKVNTSSLNVRSKSNTSSSKLGTLSKGSKVDIVEKASNGWYKIKFKNGYGYVSGSYISNVKSVNTSNNNQSSSSNTEVKDDTITGLVTKHTQTAGKSLTDDIEVNNTYGRKVQLQMYNNSKKSWETK